MAPASATAAGSSRFCSAVYSPQHQEAHGEPLLLRGIVEDCSSATSHKQQIGRLLCRGYVYTAITALTGHTEGSIEPYALQLGRVVALADAGAAKNDIRIVCDLSEQAVEIYLALYHEHNTDEFRPHLDRLKRRFEASSGVDGARSAPLVWRETCSTVWSGVVLGNSLWVCHAN